VILLPGMERTVETCSAPCGMTIKSPVCSNCGLRTTAAELYGGTTILPLNCMEEQQ
jgi:hypothetical protein